MRKLTMLLGALLLAAPLSPAQPQEAAATAPPQRIVKVLRVRDAQHVVGLLGGFNVEVRFSDRLGLITVAGDPDNVARAEQAAREIEQLSARTSASTAQDVELTAHFLGIMDADSGPPPGPLREVIAELKKTFPFQGYQLLETFALRVRVGEDSRIEGFLPETPLEGLPPTKYVFESRVAAIEPGQNSPLARFAYVRTSVRLPFARGTDFTYEEVRINTALEVADGQTVVVGKAGSTGASQGYLLVMTATVVK
jgi:hypothetical protein